MNLVKISDLTPSGGSVVVRHYVLTCNRGTRVEAVVEVVVVEALCETESRKKKVKVKSS